MLAATMMPQGPGWAGLGQTMASLMFLWAVIRQYFPDFNHRYFRRYTDRVAALVYPYIQIKFPEYTGQRFKSSEAYTNIEAYLGTICAVSAKRFRADIGKDSTKLSLSMDDSEEVPDEFMGAKVWWASAVKSRKSNSFSWFPGDDDQRYYRLTFHRRNRDLVNDQYLAHVMEKGKEARVTRRQRKLYTNNTNERSYKPSLWSHVPFEHPATFDTIAMDPEKKRDIVNDLLTFRGNKDYYAKIGRAWKRGYLLYGPPGTGKSSMVAAMANLLDYDIYDVELTSVSNNTALRKLLIETSSKSVIVIEDIDCSLDLTGQRKKKKMKDEDNKDGKDNKPPGPPGPEETKESKVTLSGLLNFIDGLWSACGGERLIVFTTNHIEKLDEALIRKGRMDKHIELSYCCFEAFKVLAKNYLDIDSHPLFNQIQEKIDESKITPADVAECLMPRVQHVTEEDITKSLESLLVAMKQAKEKALKEAEEAAATAKAEAEAATAAASATTSPATAPTTDAAATNTAADEKIRAAASPDTNKEENKIISQKGEAEKAETNGVKEVKS